MFAGRKQSPTLHQITCIQTSCIHTTDMVRPHRQETASTQWWPKQCNLHQHNNLHPQMDKIHPHNRHPHKRQVTSTQQPDRFYIHPKDKLHPHKIDNLHPHNRQLTTVTSTKQIIFIHRRHLPPTQDNLHPHKTVYRHIASIHMRQLLSTQQTAYIHTRQLLTT